nr:hypothetical protein [Oryza sativa Japonica Group]
MAPPPPPPSAAATTTTATAPAVSGEPGVVVVKRWGKIQVQGSVPSPGIGH